MSTKEAERVICFWEVATEGFGDGPGKSVDECHESCVPKLNPYVVFVPYFKKNVSMKCK